MTSPEFLSEADLEGFLNNHGNHVYTYLCVLARNEDAAAEALQNAYVKFLQKVRLGEVRAATAAQYLLTIAKNDHISRAQKESRETELPDDAQDHKSPARESMVALARDLRLILLETAADPEVPPDVAMVIRMRFLEEADLDSICKATGRSQATVYRLMEKALSILAEACKRAGLHPQELAL